MLANAGEDVEKLDFSYIAGGNLKWYRHSRNIWSFSCHASQQLYDWYLFHRNKTLCSHRNAYANVYRGFNHNL